MGYSATAICVCLYLQAYVDRVVGQRVLRPAAPSRDQSLKRAARLQFAEPLMGMLVPRERPETAPPFLGPIPALQMDNEQIKLLQEASSVYYPTCLRCSLNCSNPDAVADDIGTAVGNHTIIEMWDADTTALNDEALMRQALLRAAEAGRLNVLQQAFHSFTGQGVTGMLLLSSSHLTSVSSLLSHDCILPRKPAPALDWLDRLVEDVVSLVKLPQELEVSLLLALDHCFDLLSLTRL